MDNKTRLLIDVLAEAIENLTLDLNCEKKVVSQYRNDIEKLVKGREYYRFQIEKFDEIIKEGKAANEKQSKHIAELCDRLDTFSKGLEISKVENQELKSDLEAANEKINFLSLWVPKHCEVECQNNGNCGLCPNYSKKPQ